MYKETELEIQDLAYGGKGVGRTEEGKVCFVSDVISGERIVARIVREKRDFAEAELIEIQRPAADRVVPPCEYYGRCGGCVYQHLSYPAQLRIKRDQVVTALQRIGGFSKVEVKPLVPAPEPYYYRNRITVHTREGITGFYDRSGRRVMEIRRCIIASEPVNQMLAQYHKRHPYDGVRTLCPSKFPGFRQTNDSAASLLLEEVSQQAGNGELLIDAYCGSGFFAKHLRKQFQRVIGLEWNEQALTAAQQDALSPDEVYWQGDVSDILPRALACAPNDTLLLLDPPAQGVSSQAIQAILERPCRRIIFISCNIATLARDLKKLATAYRLAEVVPLDMFPQTAQIETVTVLEKRISESQEVLVQNGSY